MAATAEGEQVVELVGFAPVSELVERNDVVNVHMRVARTALPAYVLVAFKRGEAVRVGLPVPASIRLALGVLPIPMVWAVGITARLYQCLAGARDRAVLISLGVLRGEDGAAANTRFGRVAASVAQDDCGRSRLNNRSTSRTRSRLWRVGCLSSRFCLRAKEDHPARKTTEALLLADEEGAAPFTFHRYKYNTLALLPYGGTLCR